MQNLHRLHRKIIAYVMISLIIVNLFSMPFGGYVKAEEGTVPVEADSLSGTEIEYNLVVNNGVRTESLFTNENVTVTFSVERNENYKAFYKVRKDNETDFGSEIELTEFVADATDQPQLTASVEFPCPENEQHEYEIVYYLKKQTDNVTKAVETTAEKKVSFTIDKVKPEITVEKQEVETADGNVVTCMMSATEQCEIKVKGTQKTIDGVKPFEEQIIKLPSAEGELEDSISFTEDGIYDISFEAVDLAGNIGKTADDKSITFFMDTAAPVLTIEGAAEGEYYEKDVTLTFAAKDLALTDKDGNYHYELTKTINGEVSKSQELTWEKEDGNDCQAKADLVFDKEGFYTIELSMTDNNGNKTKNGAVRKLSFAIDKTKPRIDMLTVDYKSGNKTAYCEAEGARTIYYLNGDANLSFSVNETNYQDTKVHLKTSCDGNLLEETAYDMNKNSETFSVSYSKEGNYISEMWAEDMAGNVAESSTAQEFVIDVTKPVFEITGVKLGKTYQKNQSLTITATDVNHKVDTYKITVERTTKDGRKIVQKLTDLSKWTGNGENRQQTLTFTEEGNYLVKITGSDKAGNEGEVAATSFKIDTSAPIITQSSNLISGSYYNTSKELTGVIKEFNYEDVTASIEVIRVLDGKEYTDTKDIACEKEEQEFSYKFEEEGQYYVTVKAEDKTGNAAESIALHFVIDKTVPMLSVSGVPDKNQTRDEVKLTYQAADKNHEFFEYRIHVVRTNTDGTKESWEEVKAEAWKQNGYVEKEQNEFVTERTVSYTEEGNYEITFSGTDKAGNAAEETKFTFLIDCTAPIISKIAYSNVDGLIMEKYGIIYSNKAILVEFDVYDSVAGVKDNGVYVTTGGAADKNEKTPVYIAHKTIGNRYYVVIPTDLGIEEFDDTLTIWANDALGNEGYFVSSKVIYYNDYPNVVMNCDVDYTAWTNQDVTFHTSVSDSKSGLKEVIYRIDGKEVEKVKFTSVVNSYDFELTATESCEKVSGYTVSVEVTNNAGTTNTMERQVFIDKVKPKVTLSGVVNGTHYNTNRTIVSDVQDVSYPATKTIYMISRTLDGKTYHEAASVFHSKQFKDSCKRKIVKEGKYKIYAITTDGAGNQSVSNSLDFVIDKTAPKVSVSGTGVGSMNGTPVTLNFTCVESFFASNKVTIDVVRELDGNTETRQVKGFPKNAKKTSMHHTFSEDGTYEVTISAEDKAGNVAASKSIIFSVDQTKPEIHITGTDNYKQWNKPVLVRFSITESFYSGSSVKITGTQTDINGKVKNIDISSFSYGGKLSSLSKLFEEDGRYALEVVAKDEAGNRESAKIHFVIDKTAPEINKLSERNGGYYQEFKLANSLEDVFKDLTVISYHLLLNGLEYNGTDVIAEEGKYNLYVDAEDELGHVSSQNIEFIIDHTAPKVIFTGAKDGENVHDSGEVQLSLTNADDEITAVRMNGTDYSADTRSLAFTEYGSYRIEVDCKDKAGNSVTRTIYFVYNNPVVLVLLFGGIGSFIIGMSLWLIFRTKRKEAEERKK